MKEKTEYRDIIFKTSKTFFIFYFIIIIIFAFIYEKIIINVDENNYRNLINDLQKQISENMRQSLSNNDNFITDLNILLSELENKDNTNSVMRVALYNGNKELISKSGNYIICHTEENNRKYIDINKYLNNNEFNEIFRVKNNDDKNKIYSLTVDGYENGDEIIPQNIKVCIQVLNNDGTFKADKPSVLNEYKFSVPENKNIIKHYNITDLKLLKHNQSVVSTPEGTDLNNPYNACTDCFKSEFINLNANETYYESFDGLLLRNNKIVKNFSIYNKNYYIAFQSLYTPLTNVFKKLMPAYIFGLLLCAVFTSILSNGFYKIYREQLRLDETRRRMTSAITHEFKTPLGIIRTYSEGIKENIAEDKKDHYLDIIIDETYRMDKMVLEMLDLSKLELKLYKLKKELLCINDLVQKVLKNDEKIFCDSNIIVNYEMEYF